MAETTAPAPAPRKRRWLKITGWVAGVLVVLIVVVYFVATSSAFFKGVILPKVSAALNANVTVSDAGISPFHQVVLHNLKVQTTGADPLVTAPEVLVRYSLMDIIGGRINVEELTLTSPTVTLVQNPDGTSNLDPILKAQQQKPSAPAKPAQPSKPMQVDIKKIALTDATVRQVKLYKGENRDTTEISHLTVTIDGVKNGQTGKLALGADLSMKNNPPAPATNGLLQAKVSGNYTFALSADLKPGAIQGSTKFEVSRAEGALAQAAGLGANLDCDITPTDIKQVALRFQKGSLGLGEVRVSGPFAMEKNEGKITVEVLNIDRNLLNLAGASSGLDFGPTKISSTNVIELAKGGTSLNAAGQFSLNQFQLTRTNQTTPPLDLRADYNVSVDQAASTATVKALTLTGTQKGNQFLRGELTSPMAVSWGNTANAVGDSALNVTVTHLNLADWKPFLGEVAPAGDVNGKLQLVSQQAGKQLSFDLNSEIDDLTAGSGSNQITKATVTFQVNGKAANFKQYSFPTLKFQVAQQNQPLVTATGSGTYDQASAAADVQVEGQLMLARLLQALPRPDIKVTSGSAGLKLHLTQKAIGPVVTNQTPPAAQDITGNFTLSDFTGQVGSNSFRSYGLVADLDVGVTPALVQIRKISGKLTEGASLGGTFDLNGTYNQSNKAAQLTARVTDFNQNGLRPFLEPMLAEKKLVSVLLNVNSSVQYDPQGASTVKASLVLTNLVVNDPKGQFPSTPLAAGMQVDASLNKQVADVKQFQLSLTPTARGTNQVQLTGHIDMTDTNAMQGNIKLAADSLDLTTYYDLFGGGAAKAAPQPAAGSTTRPAATATASNSKPAPEQEPAAMKLPVRNFTADATIRRLFLHELEVADFQMTTKIDGGHVVLNPFKLSVNGAPASSTMDLDLGVPGYKYDVSFNAQAVPLRPLVNSFKPEYKDILSGTMTGQASVKGAGTTGASLQKNLSGQFDIGSTNLNLSIDSIPDNGVATRLLKTVVGAVAQVPELIKNPTGVGGSLLSGLVSSGTGSTQGTDLKKSPIDSIVLRGTMGSGQIAVRQGLIQSPSFQANVTGGVSLAPVLTNSPIQFPVGISLERSVAQVLRIAPPSAATNATYVSLPSFLVMTNTLGDAKSYYDKKAIAAFALQIASQIAGPGGKAGGIVQGLGGLLGGSTSTATNAGGTNQSKAGSLIQGLGGLLGQPAATNRSATNQSPIGNVLDQFLKPKK